MRKEASIAVIGAGISGLTFAHKARELGFTNITVLEREHEAGGKSYTVEIDGRAHDLGATMGMQVDYEPVLRHSRAAGIGNVQFPRETHFDMRTGGRVRLNRRTELPVVLSQAAKYFFLHQVRFRGVKGEGLHHASPELLQPWSEMVARAGLDKVSERLRAYRTGYGYGYDDEVAAVMYANLFRPETFWGLLKAPAFMWQGGTQPIWRALARTLNVRTGVDVVSVRRSEDGIVINTGSGETLSFDALVITVDPASALAFLDADADEEEMFSRIQAYPYATFACEVRGLSEGEAAVGYLAENMVRGREGHPMAWVKRYADQAVFVFHLFAPPHLDDAQIFARIRGDMVSIGGEVTALRAAKRWRFFPHFDTDFMQAGGMQRVAAWQGRKRTYMIGEAFSFASMARVTEHAELFASRLARMTTPAHGKRDVSFSEVREKGWVVVGDDVYDISRFAAHHPGGAQIGQLAGSDATLPLINAHGTQGRLPALPPGMIVGRIAEQTLPELDQDLRQLWRSAMLSGLFEFSRTRLAYDLLVMLGLFALAIALRSTLPLLAFVVCTLATLNVMWWVHDVCHDSVFATRAQAKRMGELASLLFVGTPVLDYQYLTHRLHHGFTNVIGGDQALQTGPFVWDEGMRARTTDGFVKVQAWAWFMLLLPMTMPLFIIAAVGTALRQGELWRVAVVALRWAVVCWLSSSALWFVFGPVLCAAYLLSAISSLNHFHKPMSTTLDPSFGRAVSVVTQNLTRTGRLATFLLGGLNFHIEHHLFSTMPRHHLRTVAPAVRALFAKHKLAYSTVSVAGAARALWEKLRTPYSLSWRAEP